MSTEENKAVAHRLGEALTSGGVAAGLDFFTDPWVLNGQQLDRQALLQIRAALWSALPDIPWTIEHAIAEGDWVAVRWSVRGTHTGDFAHPALGTAPASGKPVAFAVMDHYRIEGGQIAEVLEVSDRMTLLQQLGVVPPPGQATG